MERRIIEYKLARASIDQIDEAIGTLITQGWEPNGSIKADPGRNGYVMQVVVKYAPRETGEVAFINAMELVELTEKVESRISEGWQLFGSLTTAERNEGLSFFQTMVRPIQVKTHV